MIERGESDRTRPPMITELNAAIPRNSRTFGGAAALRE